MATPSRDDCAITIDISKSPPKQIECHPCLVRYLHGDCASGLIASFIIDGSLTAKKIQNLPHDKFWLSYNDDFRDVAKLMHITHKKLWGYITKLESAGLIDIRVITTSDGKEVRQIKLNWRVINHIITNSTEYKEGNNHV